MSAGGGTPRTLRAAGRHASAATEVAEPQRPGVQIADVQLADVQGPDVQLAEVHGAAIRRAVVTWFRAAQRSLPWREGYDPYAIWIAEIMLQQTQVATVRPYFERWMRRFPNVRAVAEAPTGEILKAWEGLGYYRRAHNLQRAAQIMVAEHGGHVPESLEALRALPGIGRYTAGAIHSIGFDRPAPIVDGNVGRLLGRLVALPVPARSPAGQVRLWALAEALVARRAAREFNQGLMELGALVCRPREPDCAACPLRPHCAAHAAGDPERFPPPPTRRRRPVRRGALLLLMDEPGRILLRRRPEHGLWAGLWEPPWIERRVGESAPAALRRLLIELDVEPPFRPRLAGELSHGLTHFELALRCYRVRLGAGHAAACEDDLPRRSARDALVWADGPRLAALPIARLGQKALRLRGPERA